MIRGGDSDSHAHFHLHLHLFLLLRSIPQTHALSLPENFAGEPYRTAIGARRRRSIWPRSFMVVFAVAVIWNWNCASRDLAFSVREREKGRKMNGIGNGGLSNVEMEYIRRHHRHEPGQNQCGSALVKHIRAPVPQVLFFF